jgi:hypothetical protein
MGTFLANIGWSLWGVEDGGSKAISWFGALVKAANKPRIRALLKPLLSKEGLAVPVIKQIPVPKGLPPGSFAATVTILEEPQPRSDGHPATAADRLKPTPIVVHLLASPEKPRTWIAIGTDQPVLVARLLAVRGTATEPETLAARDGLEGLRQAPLSGGGFFTLKGYLTPALAALASSGELLGKGLSFATAPHRGETPLAVTWTATGGPPLAWTGSVHVPKGVIDDVISLVLTAAASP